MSPSSIVPLHNGGVSLLFELLNISFLMTIKLTSWIGLVPAGGMILSSAENYSVLRSERWEVMELGLSA